MTTSRHLELSACDPATPEVELRGLARNRSERVRAGVALNPGTPSALLIGLVQDASDWVAGLAASHPRADRGVWEAALARGGRVLMDLVAIPWLDPDLAASAAATGEADVRETLARRTANRDLLVQLARGCRPQGEGRRGREPVRWTAVELTGQ